MSESLDIDLQKSVDLRSAFARDQAALDLDAQAAGLARVGETWAARMLLGDGLGNVGVPQRPGRAYVHLRDDQGRVYARSDALNPWGLLQHGMPVVVARAPRSTDLTISPDLAALLAFFASETTPAGSPPALVLAHADGHHLFGRDPAFVSVRQVEELAVSPTTPPALVVRIWPGLYWDGAALRYYAGGTSASLSSYVPGAAGQARWLLVSLDRTTGALAYTPGAVFAASATPLDDLPQAGGLACPAGRRALAVVYLVNGMAAVAWPHIHRPPEAPDEVGAVSRLTVAAATELTLAGGAVTATQTAHTIDTEDDAPDDELTTINGLVAETLYCLRAAHPDRTIVVKHGIGNIYTLAGNDVSLDDADKALLLYSPDGARALVLGDGGGGGGGADTFPDHYGPRGVQVRWAGLSEIAVQYDIVGHGATRLETGHATLQPHDAADWVDGSEAADQFIYVYVDSSGAFKLSDKAPIYPKADAASIVFTARVDQPGWNGTSGAGLNAGAVHYDNASGEAALRAGMWLGVCAADDVDYSKFRGAGSGSAGGRSVVGQFAYIAGVDVGTRTLTLNLTTPGQLLSHNIAVNDDDRLFAISGAPRYRQFGGMWYRCVGVVRNDASQNLDGAFLGQGYVAHFGAPTNPTTGSATFVPIHDSLRAWFYADGGLWRIDFSALFGVTESEGSPDGPVGLDLVMDYLAVFGTYAWGVHKLGFDYPPRDQMGHVHSQFLTAPGPHRVEVYWRTGAGTATLYGQDNDAIALCSVGPARVY